MYGHVGCNVMTPQCHVTNLIIMNMINLDLPYLNGVKFAIENIAKTLFFGRFLFNRSVVTCQCPTYKFNNEFLEIGMCFVSWSVSHRGHSRLNIFTISYKWNMSFFDTFFPNMCHTFDCTRSIYK